MYPPEVGPKPFYSLAPWILSFVLANGFFEESMARGLFLKKFELLLGAPLSNLLLRPYLPSAMLTWLTRRMCSCLCDHLRFLRWSGAISCRKLAPFGLR